MKINYEILSKKTPISRKILIDKYLKNVNWVIIEDDIEIIKTKANYLQLDIDLFDNIKKYGDFRNEEDVKNFHRHHKLYDICFEDSWSLYFISKILKKYNFEELCILHIDDHLDFMNPLIDYQKGSLYDLSQKKTIDINNPDDIKQSIFSGSIGIGSFFAPLFFCLKNINFLHLNNSSKELYLNIIPDRIKIPVLKDTSTIKLRLEQTHCKLNNNYSYKSSNNINSLINEKIEQALLIHIDLDYFINNYDGEIECF